MKWLLLSVCQRYKFRKQFTTDKADAQPLVELLSVCQRYKFRKQFTTLDMKSRYRLLLLSVCQRYKFRKQFTTRTSELIKQNSCYQSVKDINFESNSQLDQNWPIFVPLLLSVCQRYKFRKQFTTRSPRAMAITALLSVCQRYKFRKQFTTGYLWYSYSRLLLSVCQRYKFRKQFTTAVIRF